MKKIFLILLLTLPFVGFGQDMKVKWEDDDGREFSIEVLSHNFSYSMIPGDDINYDMFDKVGKVGDVTISYDMFDKVVKVGDVTISYDMFDKIVKVGGLTIRYDMFDKITGSRGSVR